MRSLPQPSTPTAVLDCISAPRLAPYLQAASGNRVQAFRLYRWNTMLSGAVYEALHIFEVVLRNAMDVQLAEWNSQQTEPESGAPLGRDWLLEPAHLIRRVLGGDLEKATSWATRAAERSSAGRRPVAHPDVVAQLSLGTWRYLLPNRNPASDPGKQRLWDESLVNAFPHLARTPAQLVDDVGHIHSLRNRVAHLEPLLLPGTMERDLRRMRRVLTEIEPHTERWLVGAQRITQVIKQRP